VQADPVVVYTGAKYVVAWSDGWLTGGFYWIATSCVDTAGAVIDTGGFIGSQAMRSECRPDIAFDNDRCLVTWYNDDQPFGVYGRFVDEFGLPEDTVFRIATTLASYNVNPKIVFTGDRYLVVWADKRPGHSDLDICAQCVSTQGEVIGAPVIIATGSSNQLDPAVAYDGTILLVTWCEDPIAIFGQRLHPDGSLLGGNFRISDDLPYYSIDPAVQASTQNFLVVWSETRDGDSDIFGNIDVAAPVEEPVPPPTGWQNATMFIDRFELPFEGNYRVYDVSGRDVTSLPMSRGIYFVEYGDRRVQKVIKVR
jgi:hypothetical protein